MKRKRNFSKETLDLSSIIANVCTIISFIGWVITGKMLLLFFLVILLCGVIFISFLKRNTPFDEIEVTYHLDILNHEGNAIVQRDTRFVNNSRFTLVEREHVIFSTASAANWCELKLDAWDNEGNKLNISSVRDDPNLKRLVIKFAKPIVPRNSYYYAYRYSWDKYFSKENETFIGQDVSYINEFIVKIHAHIKLKRIVCEELLHDGRRELCEEIKREIKQIGNGIVEYGLKVIKKERFNKTELLLTLDRTER